MRIENIDMRFELLYRKVNLLPKSNNHFVNVFYFGQNGELFQLRLLAEPM